MWICDWTICSFCESISLLCSFCKSISSTHSNVYFDVFFFAVCAVCTHIPLLIVAYLMFSLLYRKLTFTSQSQNYINENANALWLVKQYWFVRMCCTGQKKEFSSINRQNQLKRSQSSDSSRSYNNKIYLRASNLVQLSGENRRINVVLSDQFMR